MLSIICLCYNHEEFVKEALCSVFNQTYANWELIIINDCSTDKSKEVIENFVKEIAEEDKQIHHIQTIHLEKNIGNCAAFNIGFRLSKGKYVVDLAADDKMSSDRLEKQVKVLESAEREVGVCFTNATLINEKSHKIGNYYFDWFKKQPQEGLIFKELVRAGGMICSPTMLIKREVLEELRGYDENLSYEDYDFWVRSSRNWKYIFLNENLTFYRKVSQSHSRTFKKKNNPHLLSTVKVCQKALYLCQNKAEYRALSISVLYHLKESIKYRNYLAGKAFLKLFFMLVKKMI